MELTHINEQGRARMVDVSEKDDTKRIAVAFGKICMKKETLVSIQNQEIKKGDVPVSYTHLDVYKRQQSLKNLKNMLVKLYIQRTSTV